MCAAFASGQRFQSEAKNLQILRAFWAFRVSRFWCILLGFSFLSSQPFLAQEAKKKETPIPGPMLSQGTFDFDTPEFKLTLVRSSQTVAALRPKGADDFDFTPGDLLVSRSHDGYFHLGDITLRLRVGNSGSWQNYSTASTRVPVTVLPASKDVLTAADLTPTLPSDFPLELKRV